MNEEETFHNSYPNLISFQRVIKFIKRTSTPDPLKRNLRNQYLIQFLEEINPRKKMMMMIRQVNQKVTLLPQ